LAPIVDRLEFNVPKNSYFWDPRYVEQQVKKTNDLFIKNTVDLVCKMYPRRDQRYTSMTVLGPESIRESRNTLYNGETKYGTMDGRDQTDLEDPAFLYGGQHMRPLKNKGPPDGRRWVPEQYAAPSKYGDLIPGIDKWATDRLESMRNPPKLNTLRDDNFARANEQNGQGCNKEIVLNGARENVAGHQIILNEDDVPVYDVADREIYNNPTLRALNAPMNNHDKFADCERLDRAPAHWGVFNRDIANTDTEASRSAFRRHLDRIYGHGKLLGCELPRFRRGWGEGLPPRHIDYTESNEYGNDEYEYTMPPKKYDMSNLMRRMRVNNRELRAYSRKYN